jgi:hypothetical protein
MHHNKPKMDVHIIVSFLLMVEKGDIYLICSCFMNHKRTFMTTATTLVTSALILAMTIFPMQYVSAQLPPNGEVWGVSANGFSGQLVLSYNGNGQVTGTIFGDRIIGFVDGNTQKIVFMRMPNPADPSTFQVYTGYYSRDGSAHVIQGTFMTPAGAGGSPQRNEFGWSAFFQLIH